MVWPGQPYPLGATWDGQGVNFALFSENAEGVELCLFDTSGKEEVERIELRERTDRIWHCYLPYCRLGQLYGYRVNGPYDPDNGHRFNPNKLLLDPYAKATVGSLDWDYPHFGYRLGAEEEDLAFDEQDNAAGMPKCRVVDTAFTWGEDRPPRTPWDETLIYELHVKGFTQRHPDVPEDLRGTYAGLASAPAIEHLKKLGVTAVELMPVHSFVDDKHLADKNLKNYWGYNSIGFFAPDLRYSATGSISEFKTMVKRLHSAGLEVILDVVYNHTAEGNHLGPTLSFRGIDNAAYYRLMPDDPRYYKDFTGTGNTLNMMHPRVLQLIMDSLRYWILEMHVDGFRFDLASALARQLYEVDQLSSFFTIIHQDPVISQAKLIAEPWDIGEGGYQVGNFPVGWAEWNGKYRDEVRSYWKGDGGLVDELAYRLTGSSDLYERGGRRPYASVNFVTAHDGFTLSDLVSYDEKHNEANGERNNDGESHNLSRNYGVEGPTDDLEIRRIRARQRRNIMATLLLSQGVPMILSGDEMRTHSERQQQRLLPGQRDELARLGPLRPRQELPGLRAACDPAAQRTPRLPPQKLLPGPRAKGRGREGHHLAHPRGPRDDRRGVEQLPRPVPRPPDVRPPRRRARRAGPPPGRRRLPAPLQRRRGRGRLPTSKLPRGDPLGGPHGHLLLRRAEGRPLPQTERPLRFEAPFDGRARKLPQARDCGRGRRLRRTHRS